MNTHRVRSRLQTRLIWQLSTAGLRPAAASGRQFDQL